MSAKQRFERYGEIDFYGRRRREGLASPKVQALFRLGQGEGKNNEVMRFR